MDARPPDDALADRMDGRRLGEDSGRRPVEADPETTRDDDLDIDIDVDDAEGSPDNDVDLGGDDDLGVDAGDVSDDEN